MPRRATPTHLRVITGNPAKRPLPQNEPQPDALDIARVPPHLSDLAKVAWKRFAKLLSDMGVLTVADEPALERLCETYAEIAELSAAIQRRDGLTYSFKGKLVPYPEFAMRADAERRFAQLLSFFGMTPSARTKVKVIDTPNQADPATRYFG